MNVEKELDELRKKIARAKGWTLETKTITSPTRDGQAFSYEASFWKLNGSWNREPPYWPYEIDAAWELVEEMKAIITFTVRYVKDREIWRFDWRHTKPTKPGEIFNWNYQEGATAPESICRAWLAWKEGQK